MRWQEVSKMLAGISSIGVIGLFSLLFLLTGMDYTHSGDSSCFYSEGVYKCDGYINITTRYWNFEFEHLNPNSYIYLPIDLKDFKGKLIKYKVSELDFTPTLYKKSTRGRKLWINLNQIENIIDTQPNVKVDWMVPARGKDNWRPVKEGDTWDRLKNNRIKLIGYPENTYVDIKWSFLVGEIDIDPVWFGFDEPGFWSDNKLPLGMAHNLYNYNSTLQIMTDSNGLTFEKSNEGYMIVGDERYLAFALTGTVDGTNYKYTSMDFTWTWHVNETDDGHIIYATNNNPNFIWEQYYYFYKDPWKQMKIKHYLKNDWKDITNTQMYYVMNVLPEDTIRYNETIYNVSEHMALHEQGNFNELISKINFNSEFAFDFDDIINDGFNVNEFYIGNGAIINKPSINITAIGFTKNNGNFPKGADVWIDPTFSTGNVKSMAISPLDSETIAIIWADDDNGKIKFATYDINGTLKIGPIELDTGEYPDYTSVGVSAFNSTHFVLGWFATAPDDVFFKIYDSSGNLIGERITVDSTAGQYCNTVSVSAFNSTHFVIGWNDYVDEDASFRIYDSGGNAITGIIDADTAMRADSQVSVSAFNSTHFVIGWFDNDEYDVSFRIYDSSGNAITGIIDADTSAGSYTHAAAVSTFNSTHFVIGWIDKNGYDTSFRIYDSSGNALTGIIDADTDVGQVSLSVSVSAIDSTHFVIGWFDSTDGDASFKIYDSGGNNITGIIDADTTALHYQDVASYEAATGIGICNDNFIMGWVHSTSLANWSGYYGNNGSVWDRICEAEPDITAPTYSNNSTNSTLSGTDILHSLTWTDETELATTGGYIFSFDNGTGTFSNNSWSAFSSNPDWSNTTKSVNTTVGTTIQWKVYANDTSNNWATSSTYSYVTTAADSCSNCDGTADCYWDCSDDCVISSNINMGGYDIEIKQTTTGTHTTTITGAITNWGNIITSGYDASNKCNIVCINGGGFK